MNANRMINMAVRMLMRRLMRGGMDAAGKRAGKGGGPDTKATQRRARDTMKIARRIGRM